MRAHKRFKWYAFDPSKWRRTLPPERVNVLVATPQTPDHGHMSVAVGYLKFGAGDRKSPYFVTRGVGGVPMAWNDCLPDDVRSDTGWASVPEHMRGAK